MTTCSEKQHSRCRQHKRQRAGTLIMFNVLFLLACQTTAFTPATRHQLQLASFRRSSLRSSRSPSTSSGNQNSKDDDEDDAFIDADFERVIQQENGNMIDDEDGDFDYDDDLDTWKSPYQPKPPKTLIDMSLEASKEWAETRVPFCRNDEYIDCKLAFTSTIDNQLYGIAVPFDDAVAIVFEERDKKDPNKVTINYIDPDQISSAETIEENLELMEIMAAQVQEQLGKKYFLRKTPKVLTISGGLKKLTDNWETTLLPEPIGMEKLLEEVGDELGESFGKSVDMDDEVNEFLDFMRGELGERDVEQIMNDDPSDLDQEWEDLFTVPGFGTEKDDKDAMDNIINEMVQDADEETRKTPTKYLTMSDGVAALKLISYRFTKSGNAYTLAKFMKPFTVIGRYMPATMRGGEAKEMLRFELLTKEEEEIVVPKLDKVCRDDLEKAGFKL